MNAIVTHAYGRPDVLKYEQRPDPVAGPGQVLVRVVASSVNPIDQKRRSGEAKAFIPIAFPGVIGVDVAGTVAAVGPGVSGFAPGDAVFAFADQAYAELCVVTAADLVKVPEGLDLVAAAAVPLVTTAGTQLITEGAKATGGQTVLVTGAAGNVGRSAVFAAKSRGATTIAAVRKKQLATANSIGADRVVATDDPAAVAALPPLDAVADTIGGDAAAQFMAKLKSGGTFASVVGVPANAEAFPTVHCTFVGARPDAAVLAVTGVAVRDGKLVLPVGRTFPLRDAAAAHAALESRAVTGKVLLIV